MTSQDEDTLLHGTAIAIGEVGAILRGPSGAGKSDLALRLLSLPVEVVVSILPQPDTVGAVVPRLVGDDQVLVRRRPDGELWMRAPEAIRGLLEVRGIGIVRVGALAQARVAAIVDLVVPGEVERMPQAWETVLLLGREVPRARLAAFEASAPLKILHFLAAVLSDRAGIPER